MTAIEAIKKIKVALGMQKFEEVATLVDGTTQVHVDGEFAPGEQLHVVAEDGSFVPAPEGTHETTEGKLITVDAAGVIVSVEEKSTEEMEEEKKEEMEEEKKEEMEEEKVEVTMNDEIVAKVIEAIAPIVTELEETKEELKKLKASFSKFSNEPAAEPVKNNFSKVSNSNTALDKRLQTIAELRNK